MSQPLLRVHDLWAGYGGQPVLRGISLDLAAGAAPIGVIGPSGAGKTTLAEVMLGRVKPLQGHATFGGKAVHRLSRGERKTFRSAVRHVSQYGVPTQDPRLTCERYLSGALSDARKAGRTHATSIPALLEFVALEPRYAGRTLMTLSGGERQRLALAHALATRPDALVLDEPLTAIDPGLRAEVLRRLGAVVAEAGIAVLLVSHDLESVERLCAEVHVLAEGTFVASGALADVLRAAQHPAVVDLAEAAPLTAQRLR